jgi:hypothetical protein
MFYFEVLQHAVYQRIPYLPLFRFQAQEKNAPYPPLGPKESKGNKREFTKEQLEAGKNIVAMRF